MLMEKAQYNCLLEKGKRYGFSVYGSLQPYPKRPAYPHVYLDMPAGVARDTSTTVANQVTSIVVCKTKNRQGITPNLDVMQLASYVTEALTGSNLELNSDVHKVVGMHRDPNQGFTGFDTTEGEYDVRVVSLRFRYMVQTLVEA
jgi:hypothetical protein